MPSERGSNKLPDELEIEGFQKISPRRTFSFPKVIKQPTDPLPPIAESSSAENATNLSESSYSESG